MAATFAIAPLAQAATLTVNTLGEPATIASATCAASCTLRDAINAAASGDTIQFAPALDNQVISLTFFSSLNADNSVHTGLGAGQTTQFGASAFFLTGGKALTIDATVNGLTHGVIIERNSGAANFRLFDLDTGTALTLRGLVLRNGVAKGNDGFYGGGALGGGGAIFSRGALVIDRCTFYNNTAQGGSALGPAVTTGGAGVGGVQQFGTPGGGPNGGPGGNLIPASPGGDGGLGGGGGAGTQGTVAALASGANGGPGGFGGNGGYGGGGGLGGSGGAADTGFSLASLYGGSGAAGGIGGFGGGGGGGGQRGASPTFSNLSALAQDGAGGLSAFGGGTGGLLAGGGGAGMGGAIFMKAGSATVTNSTFTANSALGGAASAAAGRGSGMGGAIFNDSGVLTVSFSTLAFNTVASGASGTGGSASGGAVYALIASGVGVTLNLSNSIAAANPGGAADVELYLGSGNSGGGGNLIGAAVGYIGGFTVPTSLNISPTLAANGGFGLSLLPLTGSNAINGAPNCLDANGAAVTIDQTGQVRPQGIACDVGAVELPLGVLPTFQATPGAAAGGGVSPSTPQTVIQGATTTFTVLPASGNRPHVGGTCGGSLNTLTNVFTTNPVTANCTVNVTFTTLCTPGTYSATGDVPCTAAAPGFYVPTSGATAPLACPANATSTAAGLAACDRYTVQNAADSGPGSLRDAFTNILSGGVISFANALDGQVISLTTFSNLNGDNSLHVGAGAGETTQFGPSAFFLTGGKALTIDATLNGLTQGVIIERNSGSANFRLFDLDTGTSLTLRGLTLRNGIAQGGNGYGLGGGAMGAGGAIFSRGALLLDRCTLNGNLAQGGSSTNPSNVVRYSGGVGGDATATSSGGPNGIVLGSSSTTAGFGGGSPVAGGFGGGGSIQAGFGGGASAFEYINFGSNGSGFGGGITLASGAAGGAGMGGAIFSYSGSVTLINSTLAGNTAQGGANSTFSSCTNTSGLGGALFNYGGNVKISFSTLAGNAATDGVTPGCGGGPAAGGAVYHYGGTLNLTNSIAANSAGGTADVFYGDGVSETGVGSGGSGSGNLIGNAAGFTGGFTVPASLNLSSTLAANGGFGQTLLPLTASDAINGAASCLDANGVTVAIDQRGIARPLGGVCDVGAVEVAATFLTVTPGAVAFGAFGTIMPSTPQSVASGRTTHFTVTPAANFTVSVGGTCGGNLVGNTYTTLAVTASCSVAVSFIPGPCPTGSYSTTGNAPCTTASAGFYVTGPGATAQTACLAGTYNPTPGATSVAACVPAATGSYVPTAGQAAQTPCAAGSYSASPGATVCTLAGVNFFVALPGANSQTACPPGQTAAGGATVCTSLTIAIAPASMANGIYGSSLGPVNFSASGATAPYTFTVIAGALPGGVTLSATGVLSGTPNATGAYAFTIKATDANGATGSRAYVLTINPAGQTISFSPPGVGAYNPGSSFSLAANASSGLTVTFSSQTPLVCLVIGSKVTLATLGTCTIAADQGGNANYAAAATVTQTFAVVPPVPGPPEGLSCQPGPSKVNCAAAPPLSNGSSIVTGYTLTCTSLATSQAYIATLISAGPFVLVNLPAGALYACTMTASSAQGSGAASNVAYVIPYSNTALGNGIDSNGNGRAEIVVRVPGTGQLLTGSLNGQNQLTFAPTFGPGASVRVLGAGAVVSGHRSDLLLQDSVSGTVKLWAGFEGPPDSEITYRAVKPGWVVDAIADIDGDGQADIVWRYVTPGTPDSGVVFVWFMKGTSIDAIAARGGAPLTWQLIGAANLHGNARNDLIWVDPQGSIRSITAQPNRAYVNEPVGSVPSGFSLTRLGDFDGDGKADFLFQDSAGHVKLWAMNGITLRTAYDLPAVDPAWTLFATGDFNGDGTVDIAWKQPDGTLTLWLMNAANPALPTVIANAGSLPAGAVNIGP